MLFWGSFKWWCDYLWSMMCTICKKRHVKHIYFQLWPMRCFCCKLNLCRRNRGWKQRNRSMFEAWSECEKALMFFIIIVLPTWFQFLLALKVRHSVLSKAYYLKNNFLIYLWNIFMKHNLYLLSWWFLALIYPFFAAGFVLRGQAIFLLYCDLFSDKTTATPKVMRVKAHS